MAWDGDAPSERQIRTIAEMARYYGIRIPERRIAGAMAETRGRSLTFFRGRPATWRDEVSPANLQLIEDLWGRLHHALGLRAVTGAV